MKKLMLATAVIAMAFGAKAEFAYASMTLTPSFDGITDFADYNTCYLLNTVNYQIWSANPTASSLANASWAQPDFISTLGSNMSLFMLSNESVDASKARFPVNPEDGKTYQFSVAVVFAKGNESFYATVTSTTAKFYNGPFWDISSPGIVLSGAPTSFAAEPVPEPTSGLLLLIGVAGLALKRKRA